MPRWIASSPLTVRRRITLDHVADVGDQIGFGQVAAPVARLAGGSLLRWRRRPSRSSSATVRSATTFTGFEQLDRTQVAGLAAEMRHDFGSRWQSGSPLQARIGQLDLASLDLVEVVVTTHQQQPDGDLTISPCSLASSVASTRDLTVRLRGTPSSSATSAQVVLPGVGTLARRLVRPGAVARQGQGFGHFDVGGVVAGGAVDDGVFASVGDHLELVRTGRRRWRRCRRPRRGTAGPGASKMRV